jgi:hypothetical protein
MEQLIKDIYEIIQDYRIEDNLMSEEIIKTWIEQFEQDDRIFILEEMKSILQKRYISKARAKVLIKEMIEFLSKEYNFNTPKEFLQKCCFIDNQHEGKSQKILLELINEIVQSQYGIELKNCDCENPEFYIYADDVFCTGDTFVKSMTKNEEDDKGWFHQTAPNGKTNLENFKQNKAKLVLSYFSIHRPNIANATKRIYRALGNYSVSYIYAWEIDYEVDKNINDASKMNFIFPKEDTDNELLMECIKQIEGKIDEHGYLKDKKIIFRPSNKPDEEEFFTSSENRDRFEKIILNKCIEIYNSSAKLHNSLRPRPLGYGLYADISLGFGTLIFTWRNVPYNVPLVFWYKSHHWSPLFERNHT